MVSQIISQYCVYIVGNEMIKCISANKSSPVPRRGVVSLGHRCSSPSDPTVWSVVPSAPWDVACRGEQSQTHPMEVISNK